MQVKSIAECSKGSILQYIRPSLSYHVLLNSLFCLFLSGRLRQVLLYAQMSLINDDADKSRGARGLIYSIRPHLLPYIVYGSREGPMCSLEPSLLADVINTGILLNSGVIGKKHTDGVQSHKKRLLLCGGGGLVVRLRTWNRGVLGSNPAWTVRFF